LRPGRVKAVAESQIGALSSVLEALCRNSDETGLESDRNIVRARVPRRQPLQDNAVTRRTVPDGTPEGIIARVNKSVNATTADKDMIERMRKLGAEPIGGSAEDAAKLLAEENVKWRKAIQFAGLKPEQ
jgi:hypothetical protein